MSFDVYSDYPIYAGLTLAQWNGSTKTFEIVPDAGYDFINPMNTSAFLDTFTTAYGVYNYFSDSYNVIFTNMKITESTWDSKHTYIPPMEINCCTRALIITTNTPEVKIANMLFFLLRGINLLPDGDKSLHKKIVNCIIRSPNVINQSMIYVNKGDYEGLLSYLLNKVFECLLNNATDWGLSNMSNMDSLKKLVDKDFCEKLWGVVKKTAKALDLVAFPIFFNNSKPDVIFIPCFDAPPSFFIHPAIFNFTLSPSKLTLGDPLNVQFNYCDPDGLHDSGSIKIFVRQGTTSNVTEYTFATREDGKFNQALDTSAIPSPGIYQICPLVTINGESSVFMEQEIEIISPDTLRPVVSNLEVPAELPARQGFNVRFQYDDPEGYADIVKFVIERSDRLASPDEFLNVANAGKVFDMKAINGMLYSFQTPGYYLLSVHAVDKRNLSSLYLQKLIKVTNPVDTDDDGDGYSENQGDCNDEAASIYPGASEICHDNIDQNCNGQADEGCLPDLPTTPQNVSATYDNYNGYINWNPVNTALFYNLYFSQDSSVSKTNYGFRQTVNATSVIVPLTKGQSYFVVVTSVNAKGESEPSSQVFIATTNTVYFPDPNLEAAVRTAINKPSGDILISDVQSMTSLNVGNNYWTPDDQKVKAIRGIEHCTKLTKLDLGYNQISDISPLAGLTNLTKLDLGYNKIIDISPLAGLTNLTELYLTWNQISNLSPLAGLTNLTWLDLDNNQISNLSPLAGLTNLTGLYLTWNQISNLSPLAGLTKLTLLGLGDNQISNLSPLAGLTNLITLYLHINQISDISPIAGLTNLTVLWLGGNQISNLSPLAGLTNLTVLWLGGNQISDISPLAGLTNLTELYLYDNQISDLSPLAGLTNLTRLDLYGNQISNLSPLAGLTNLGVLYLHWNHISDISPLAGLTNLTQLSIAKNQISDIKPLVDNTGINSGDYIYFYLYGEGNPLSTTSCTVYIPQLQSRGVNVEHDCP